jgi:PadR family transcriptional regulator PadR
MYHCPMYSKELLKGTLKTIILKLLADNDRMYGYEITQRVKELTDGQLVLTEGALYPNLHKLEAEGWVSTEREYIGKRVRRYYSLTPKGQEATVEKLSEFEAFVQTMSLIFKPRTT